MEKVENITYKSIGKKAISCMRVVTAIWALIVIAICVITLIILCTQHVLAITPAVIIGAVVFLLCATYFIAAPVIRHKRYKYYIDDDMLVVVEGLLFIKESIAPIERIHQIELKRGPIDRMFGMSNVVVTTAGGQVKIAFLDTDVAEKVAARLRKRINGIVKAEREEQAQTTEVV